MRKLSALLASVALAIALAPSASAAVPPCAYGDYFNSYGSQIRSTPVQTVGSQAGKAWCAGFQMWVSPSSWVYEQRAYELGSGR